MPEAKKGIDTFLLFRLLKEAGRLGASKLAFQTEHEIEKSRKADSTTTKDGNVQTTSAIEYDFSAKSIVAKGDEMIKKLEDAIDANEIVEIWEIDKGEASQGNKYPATYYQGYISKFKKSAKAEDSVELEIEFAINGVGQKGMATLTAEQSQVVQYVFKDTVKE